MNLVLFTTSYPYVTGAEQNFIEVELQYLSKEFDQIFIVPQNIPLYERKTQISANIHIENEYANRLKRIGKIQNFLLGLLSRLTYTEIFQNPSLLLKPLYLKRLVFFCGLVNFTSQWLTKWIKTQNIPANQYLFYTYWFDYATTGIALTKRKLVDIKLISRAHGYDIYEARNTPPYWPCRVFTIQNMESLFPDSASGTKYLHTKYPQFASQIETAYLGILDNQITSQPSTDGIYRIVSCSRMVQVKRLDLLLQGLQLLAAQNPSRKFEWCHFGEGQMLSRLEEQANHSPKNLRVKFSGYTTQKNLFKYYRDNPVDVFMNVSESEGTSVAIMEAISCGIPIIATAVGGNKEIVTNQNGILLPENPAPQEIANTILDSINKLPQKRSGSRQVWQERYNAQKNFSDFAKMLAKIRSS